MCITHCLIFVIRFSYYALGKYKEVKAHLSSLSELEELVRRVG